MPAVFQPVAPSYVSVLLPSLGLLVMLVTWLLLVFSPSSLLANWRLLAVLGVAKKTGSMEVEEGGQEEVEEGGQDKVEVGWQDEVKEDTEKDKVKEDTEKDTRQSADCGQKVVITMARY